MIRRVRDLTNRAVARLARVMWRDVLRVQTVMVADESRTELIRLHLGSRLALSQAIWRSRRPEASPASIVVRPHDLGQVLARLEALHPRLYPIWRQINFETNREEYATRPNGSCSVSLRGTDLAFACFIAPYLHGAVLDVGCGPYAVPSYLREYPSALLYGIDPLEPLEPHPFTFVRGLAESLPFPDAAFDAVVAATSLDHAFSLDLALGEIRRVMKPGGVFLVWDGFVKGSRKYDPADETVVPVDRFHLFHFDETWFEEMMQEYGFEVREKLMYDSPPYNPRISTSCFYALQRQETGHA